MGEEETGLACYTPVCKIEEEAKELEGTSKLGDETLVSELRSWYH